MGRVLDVEHAVFQILMYTIPPHPHRTIVNATPPLRLGISTSSGSSTARCHRLRIVRVQNGTEVASGPLARDVRVVRRRDQADGLRGSNVQVRRVVGARLDLVRREVVLVVDDCIMGGLDRSLQAIMRL